MTDLDQKLDALVAQVRAQRESGEQTSALVPVATSRGVAPAPSPPSAPGSPAAPDQRAARWRRRASRAWLAKNPSNRPWRPSKRERPLCGARTRGTRAGRTCQARVCERPNGTLAARCRMHGGKSTGPRTPEGRRQAAANMAHARTFRWAQTEAGVGET